METKLVQMGPDWNGDTYYYGEIHSQGEINWVKVNDDENRGFLPWDYFRRFK